MLGFVLGGIGLRNVEPKSRATCRLSSPQLVFALQCDLAGCVHTFLSVKLNEKMYTFQVLCIELLPLFGLLLCINTQL